MLLPVLLPRCYLGRMPEHSGASLMLTKLAIITLALLVQVSGQQVIADQQTDQAGQGVTQDTHRVVALTAS